MGFAQLGVGHPVMPGQSGALPLDQRARRPGGELLQNGKNGLFPAGVVRAVALPGASRFRTGPEAVLRVQPDGHSAQPAFQDGGRPAADNVNGGARSRRQGLKQLLHLGVGNGQLGRAGQGNQRAVVVQQQQQAVGTAQLLVHGLHPGMGRLGLHGLGGDSRSGFQSLDETVRPVVAVVGQNAAAQYPHAGPPFFLRKRKTVADGGGHSVDVVGIDGNGFPQLFGSPGKLAQHQDAVFIGAGGHKLLGHQVHSVPQGSDQHQVGRAVERDQLGLGYGAVKVVYGHRVYGRVAPLIRPTNSSRFWRYCS